jgi:hypothetical protein
MKHAIHLQDGEEIITIVRRHWFHLALEGALYVFVFVLTFIGTGAVDVLLADAGSVDSQQSFAVSLYVLAFVGLLLWVRFFASWSDHWLDAWVITNKRIIDIEQAGFFRRQVSSFPLDRIQDVTYDISGVVAMWLHFGDIRIQTASISENLIMRQVPFPEDIKEHLMEVLNAAKGA